MMAAMIVEAAARATLPRHTVTRKIETVLMMNPVMNRAYSNTVTTLRPKTRTRLKSSFPNRTALGEATSWSVSPVPRSSSAPNVRDNPDMAAKNRTTQSMAERTSGGALSLPSENRMMEIVVTTNMISALMAYLVRSSERASFAKMAYTERAQSNLCCSGGCIEVHLEVNVLDIALVVW